MTQVIVGTSRSSVSRFLLPLIGGIVALGLVGCSSQTASVDVDPALTQPQVQSTRPIAFAPTIGVPAKNAPKLSEALIAAAGQKHIPIMPTKEADYTIRSYASAKPGPKGTTFTCRWEIWDKAGKRIKHIEVSDVIEGKKGGDAWALVDDAAMQRMASKTTDELLAFLPKEGAPGAVATTSAVQSTSVTSQPATTNNASTTSLPATKPSRADARPNGPVLAAAQAETPRSGPAVAVVMPVTGAPGDGVTSLTNAMKQSLQQQGVTLASGGNSSPNTYTVKGSVQMDKANNGQQPIVIKWIVYGPNGQQLNQAVVQRNSVQEGSLDGAWGQVADMAAGEAAKSVAKMIAKPAG